MATSNNYADRINVPFFKDDKEDLILLIFVSRLTRKRNRGNKIKELLINYLKNNMNEYYREIEEDLIKIGFEEALNTTFADTPQIPLNMSTNTNKTVATTQVKQENVKVNTNKSNLNIDDIEQENIKKFSQDSFI